jgi:hypothetical protein
MSGIQKFFTALFPRRAADMEAESRRWMLTCPSCGHERSVWDVGGIRWKAAKNARKVKYMTCPQCGKSGWHRYSFRQDTGPAGP